MWRTIVRDVGLEAARAGVKEALKKIDKAIAGPPAAHSAQKIKVDVLCPRCKAVLTPRGGEAGETGEAGERRDLVCSVCSPEWGPR
jgi:hypothetical protein